MAYADTATVLLIVPGITTAGDAAAASALNEHVRRADGLINGKLARRYDVPFTSTSVPPLVRRIAEDISAADLFKSMFSRDSQNKNDNLEENKKDALILLDEIRDSKIDLVNTAGSLLTEKSTDTLVDASTENYHPIFDVGSATSWSIDSDRIDDITKRKS